MAINGFHGLIMEFQTPSNLEFAIKQLTKEEIQNLIGLKKTFFSLQK